MNSLKSLNSWSKNSSSSFYSITIYCCEHYILLYLNLNDARPEHHYRTSLGKFRDQSNGHLSRIRVLRDPACPYTKWPCHRPPLALVHLFARSHRSPTRPGSFDSSTICDLSVTLSRALFEFDHSMVWRYHCGPKTVWCHLWTSSAVPWTRVCTRSDAECRVAWMCWGIEREKEVRGSAWASFCVCMCQ